MLPTETAGDDGWQGERFFRSHTGIKGSSGIKPGCLDSHHIALTSKWSLCSCANIPASRLSPECPVSVTSRKKEKRLCDRMRVHNWSEKRIPWRFLDTRVETRTAPLLKTEMAMNPECSNLVHTGHQGIDSDTRKPPFLYEGKSKVWEWRSTPWEADLSTMLSLLKGFPDKLKKIPVSSC